MSLVMESTNDDVGGNSDPRSEPLDLGIGPQGREFRRVIRGNEGIGCEFAGFVFDVVVFAAVVDEGFLLRVQ
jgi:hypothetical protein